eukprot:3564961-Prymnesium_polylepis.1
MMGRSSSTPEAGTHGACTSEGPIELSCDAAKAVAAGVKTPCDYAWTESSSVCSTFVELLALLP